MTSPTPQIALATAVWCFLQAAAASAQSSPGDESGTTIVPLPAVFYQPETGTAFGAVLGLYGGGGQEGRTSEVELSFIYTVKQQVLAGLAIEQYPSGGRYWLSGGIDYQFFPTKYWGIGNDTPEAGEEDYTPQFLGVRLDAQRSIGTRTFAGLTVDMRFRALSEVTADGLLDTRPGPDDRSNLAGIGVVTTGDWRDKRLAPERGGFFLTRAMLYPSALSNGAPFTTLTVDARRFVGVLPKSALAFRVWIQSTGGDAPFDMLPALGGDQLLRGYFQGRFRDRHLIALESGFRFPIVWLVRGAAFAGVGQVADAVSDVALDRFKASVGGGLRFVLDREAGVSIRVDYAWAVDVRSGGLYFGLGEAF